MRTLEVFFDYACPFCLKGHEYLKELLPLHPDVEAVWRPCELHPRPELYGLHTDLCIQGLFHALEQGANIWDYHDLMYAAALEERVNIEDPEVIAARARSLLDSSTLLKILKKGEYDKAVTDANDYAYKQSGVWALPAYRMGALKLDSIVGVGVTKAQLADFLRF